MILVNIFPAVVFNPDNFPVIPFPISLSPFSPSPLSLDGKFFIALINPLYVFVIASTAVLFAATIPFLIPVIKLLPSDNQLYAVNTLTIATIICGILAIRVGIA